MPLPTIQANLLISSEKNEFWRDFDTQKNDVIW